MEIIDSHTHWGPSASLGISVTTDELLSQARQSGVDRIVIFPFPSQALADERINEELLNETRRVPQFIPYYYIPRRPAPDSPESGLLRREMALDMGDFRLFLQLQGPG